MTSNNSNDGDRVTFQQQKQEQEQQKRSVTVTKILIWLTFPFTAGLFFVVGLYDYVINTCVMPCWDALCSCLCSSPELPKPDGYCDMPPIAKEGQEVMPVPIFYLETANWSALRRHYYAKSIPFVLRHKDGKPFSLVEPPSKGVVESGKMYFFGDRKGAKNSGLRAIARRFVLLRFSVGENWVMGSYGSSHAHVDGGPGSKTIYFMRSGSKDVILVPRQETRAMKLAVGSNNLNIPGSAESDEWLQTMDKRYYRLILEEQSILVFNGSGCLHHFKNIPVEGVYPKALTVGNKDGWGADTRIIKNIAFNPRFWWTTHSQIWAYNTGDAHVRDYEVTEAVTMDNSSDEKV